MTKKELYLLGGLDYLKDTLYHEAIDHLKKYKTHCKELAQKLKLIDTIKNEIEENSRGFKKSKLPYKKVGVFLLENNFLPYKELLREVQKILLEIDKKTTL